MNIKDSYLHGGQDIVKNITFGTNSNNVLTYTITWARENKESTTNTISIPYLLITSGFGTPNANLVFASPTSGNAGAPSFRSLVAADIPDISADKITTGTLGAGILPLASNSTKGAVILGVAQTLTAITIGEDKNYGVGMTSLGLIYVNVPWADTHYTAVPILGSSNDAVLNVSSDTDNDATYLNIIENRIKSGGILIVGSGSTTVSAKDGVLTISSTNTTYSGSNLIFLDKNSNPIDTYQPLTSPDKIFKAGDNIALIGSNNTITIAAIDTTYTLKVGTSTTENLVTILDGTSPTSGTIITNSAYNASTNKLATMDDIAASIATAVTAMFQLKGAVASFALLPKDSSVNVGYAYRASAGFDLPAANSITGSDLSIEAGDLLVCTTVATTGNNDTSNNDAKYLVLQTNWSIDVPNPVTTLSTSDTLLATVGGKLIKVKLPIAGRETYGVILLPLGEGSSLFLCEDGSWAAPTVRPIYLAGEQKLANTTKSTGINFVNGSNTTITFTPAGLGEGESGSNYWANLTISSTDLKVKFNTAATNTSYYLPVKNGDSTNVYDELYLTPITVTGTTITASLNGTASTATDLSKTNGRGYLYLSEDTTTSYTGVGGINQSTEIGIPYIGYDDNNSANTYGLYEDLFYLSGTTKYIGDLVHSNKFATISGTPTLDDWSGSDTSGSGSYTNPTNYSAGYGISIDNQNQISVTNKEWYGTEALFNALTTLDINTTYYIEES